ncbi:MAG: carotenoid biosynthesis protein [Anaerolineae bacterium]|nr:carotenoid biosynthesis protein [Anaerolineae bacterium]
MIEKQASDKQNPATRFSKFAARRFFLPLAGALRRESQGQAATLWASSLILWLAVLVSTPVVLWLAGEGPFPRAATLGVLAQAAATLFALACGWSARRLVGVAAVVLPATWAVEKVGVTTGWLFGRYAYTGALQPQLAGVPIVIPLAWLMMLATAWAVASAILPEQSAKAAGGPACPGWWYRLRYAALSGLAFAAWDLYLDPQMVARRLWLWEEPSGYFGIPWLNYLGWWCSATLLTLIAGPGSRGMPRLRLMIIYSLTWLFQVVGLGFFWGQPGPALCGFVAMGVFAILSWRQEMRRWSRLPALQL